MGLSRRDVLKAISILPLATFANSTLASEATILRINIPGPLSLPFLPIELIPILGIDKKLNVQLVIRYFPSGVRALEDMLAGNAQFSAQGFTVLHAFKIKVSLFRRLHHSAGEFHLTVLLSAVICAEKFVALPI
jgi:ABC-type nitrate/sulfonate/bicarbonate transport system substrate-binding protein